MRGGLDCGMRDGQGEAEQEREQSARAAEYSSSCDNSNSGENHSVGWVVACQEGAASLLPCCYRREYGSGLSSMLLPPRASASTAPDWELRRKSTLEAPASSWAEMTRGSLNRP